MLEYSPQEYTIIGMKKSLRTKEHNTFIERLRKARVEAGLNQVQVAKKLGCTQSYISKLESGELKVDVVKLKRFAELYGKNVNYFLK